MNYSKLVNTLSEFEQFYGILKLVSDQGTIEIPWGSLEQLVVELDSHLDFFQINGVKEVRIWNNGYNGNKMLGVVKF